MASSKLIATGVAAALAASGVQAGDRAPKIDLEITDLAVAFDGRSFGDHGVYEKLIGVAHLQIDPTAPDNKGIVDLEHAPRDGFGMVRYDVDVEIWRPRDPARGQKVMVYEVVNRGNRLIPMMTGDGPGAPDGDFLMRQGYTVVWSGWQGDIADPALIGARLPVASKPDGPIVDRVGVDAIFDDQDSDSIALPYAASSLDQATARLTVRQRADDPERELPASAWSFAGDRKVMLRRPADMDAGAIYRFSYMARDPRVMGLGFAAVRDVVSWLRHAPYEDGNPLGRTSFDTVISIGISQSGRYLRDFLWQGFNRDLAGRKVFDGVISMIPGGRRSFTNFRFAEPGRFSRQHEEHDVPGFDFPFAYSPVTDPVTGKTDSITARCEADGTCPRIFHLDTSGEFWQAGSSLVGTGGLDRDREFPAHVRAYLIAGGSHGPNMTLPICQSPANPLVYGSLVRSLTVALIEWTRDGKEPPASRWPRIDRGELVAFEDQKHPDLTPVGIDWPKVINRPIPPAGAKGWPVLVPVVDADGTDLPGIRLPEVAAATGSYLPWNMRRPGYAAGDMCFVFGAWSPFAKDAASRGGDPRLSIQERYATTPRSKVMLDSIAALHKDRLLLDEDVAAMTAQAKE